MDSSTIAEELRRTLNAQARTEAGPDGPLRTLGLAATRAIAQGLGLSPRQVEWAAVQTRIMPARYRRNLGTVGWEGQAKLLESCAAVVGCGGLGGWVVEGLARMGVGRLILVDGDRFEEDNLNRQLGCLERCMGRLKVEVLAERVRQVNSAVEVVSHGAVLRAANAREMLDGAQVVVDALDSLPARYDLQAAASEMGIPMVHGAVGGYQGQVMTIMPGDEGLVRLYGQQPAVQRGVEMRLGNPAATPMLIAAWQLAETVKVLIGEAQLLRHRILFVDTLHGDAREIAWDVGAG